MNVCSPGTMKMGGALSLRTSLFAGFSQQGYWLVQAFS